MNKKILISLILMVSLLATTAASPMPQTGGEDLIIHITQIDTSHFPQVTVYVSVTNQAGEPVAVDSDHLILKENGKVIDAQMVQGSGEAGPLTTMLVLDTSGSMASVDKMINAKKVAAEYITQMRSGDQAGIIGFNDGLTLNQAVSADREELLNAIDSLHAKGDTAMYDALLAAVDELNSLGGRKAIIVLTDGLDNRSNNSAEDVLKAIGQSGLSISTVGLGDPGQGSGNLTALDEKGLTTLADQAGGRYGFANDRDSLQALYEQFGRALKSEYQIVYTSPSKLRDGLSRSLTVSMTAGGVLSTSSTGSNYNPGGLVPEVEGAASWPVFFILLAVLLLLMFVPTLVRLFAKPAAATRSKTPDAPKRSRIKLIN